MTTYVNVNNVNFSNIAIVHNLLIYYKNIHKFILSSRLLVSRFCKKYNFMDKLRTVQTSVYSSLQLEIGFEEFLINEINKKLLLVTDSHMSPTPDYI